MIGCVRNMVKKIVFVVGFLWNGRKSMGIDGFSFKFWFGFWMGREGIFFFLI